MAFKPGVKVPHVAGPFLGMRYKANPEVRDPAFAFMAQDMIPFDPVRGGPYIRRPSDHLTTVKTGSSTTLQHLGVFRKRSGFVGVAVVDGEIYTVSGSTWTRQVTTANLTTASITLSATARVFAKTFNNTYVINDGVNRPFTWDGTSGAGGLVSLTSAPSKCYGKPAVYYGKLFFIKDVASSNADRSKVVWSEEYAANTGYESGGYANVWQLEQSGAGALYAIVGTNSGLYYFRKDAIGVINGAVTPAFTTSGVHDDVSALVGTTCPDVLWYDKYLYFFDDLGRPHRLPEGGVVEELWTELADLYAGPDTPGQGLVNNTSYDGANSNIAPFPWVKGVVFAPYNSTSNTQPINWLFSHQTGRCMCRINPQTSTIVSKITGASYDSTNNRQVLAFGNVATSNAYATFCPVVSGDFYDYQDSGGAQFTRAVTVGPFGGTPDVVWRFRRVGVTATVGATSSSRTGQATLYIGTTESPFSNFTTQGAKSFAASQTYQRQSRIEWGIDQRLRWMTLNVQDGGGYEGWGVYQVVVDATPEEMESDKS
jgi:hypothetical protein